MATGIIDLDLTPPAAGHHRRRFTFAGPVLVVAVVLAALLTLGAAASPRRGITHLLSAGGQPAAAFVLSDDALFTASFGNNPNSESAVRRWNLPGGALGWAVALPQNVQNLVYDQASGVLMARSANEPKVTFLDGATGQVLWHDESPNSVVRSLTGGRVLMATDLEEQRCTLRLLDARSGSELWRRTVDNAYLGDDERIGAPPTRLVAADAAGHAVVLNLADGAEVARGDLQVEIVPHLDNTLGWGDVGLSVVGDTLYVSRRDQGADTLAAWSLATLRLRWRSTVGATGNVLDCGPALCVAEQEAVAAVDRRDGRMLWRRSGLVLASVYDDRSLIGYEGTYEPQALLLDPATGAVRQRLGGSIDLGGVLLRVDTVRLGRTWVEVTAADGALHVVGVLETAASFGCELHRPYLACPTTVGPTQVWRIPLQPT